MLHNFIINMRSQDAMLYYTKIITHCYVVQFHNLNVFYIYSYTMYVCIFVYSQSNTVTKPNTSRLLSFTARVGTTAPVTSVMYLEL